MTTTVQFADGSAVQDAIAAVRNDATEVNWTLAKHKDNEVTWIQQAASGTGGVNELVANLDRGAVMYGLVRLTQKIDLSTTVKFVYIYFVGDEVPFIKQGRIGIVQGDVKRYFAPFHIDFEITRPEELNEDIVMTKLLQNSGKMDNVRDNIRNDPTVKERGFTATSTGVPVARKSNFGFQGQTATAQGAVSVQIDESLIEAAKDVRDNKTETNWCLGKYENEDVKKSIVAVGKGSGGVSEMIEHLSPETIAYGLVRVTDVIEGISTVKFVYINYIGAEVGFMKKAKISTHKGAITSAFGSYHVDFDVSSARELSDDIVHEKVASNSGSKSKVR
jgi:hypothetical protein